MNDMTLTPPEPEDPDPVRLLMDILGEADDAVRETPEPGRECLPRYWQGKKDGIRTAMIVLDLMSGDQAKTLRAIQRASSTARYTLSEEDAIFPDGWQFRDL